MRSVEWEPLPIFVTMSSRTVGDGFSFLAFFFFFGHVPQKDSAHSFLFSMFVRDAMNELCCVCFICLIVFRRRQSTNQPHHTIGNP